MSKEFTGVKLDFMDRVADDVAAGFLPDKALLLAHRIAQHLNSKSGECWPGQARLARLIGANVRTVQRLTKALIDRGHLETSGRDQIDEAFRKRSRDKTLRYRFANTTPVSHLNVDPKATPVSHSEEGKHDISRHQTRHSEQAKATFDDTKGDTSVVQTPSEHLQEHLQRTPSRARARASAAGLQTLREAEEEDRKEAESKLAKEQAERKAYQEECDRAQGFLHVCTKEHGCRLSDEEFLKAKNIVVNLITNGRAKYADIFDAMMLADVPDSAFERLHAFATEKLLVKDEGRGGGFKCKDRARPNGHVLN